MASSTSAYVRERANRSPSDSSVPRTSPLVRIACTPTSRAGITMREKPKSSLRWRVTPACSRQFRPAAPTVGLFPRAPRREQAVDLFAVDRVPHAHDLGRRKLNAQRRIRFEGSGGLARWRRGPTPELTAEPYLMPCHFTGHSTLVSEHALGFRCQEHASTGDYSGLDLALAVASPPTVAVGIIRGTYAPERRLRTVHVPSVLIGAPLHRNAEAFIEAAAG